MNTTPFSLTNGIPKNAVYVILRLLGCQTISDFIRRLSLFLNPLIQKERVSQEHNLIFLLINGISRNAV